MECMKQKKRDWMIRLMEDIKLNKNAKFITLTFNNESITKLYNEIKLTGYALDNRTATLAVHRFRERWRKQFKKSIRHFLVTELGHNGTENIHLHGFIWTNEEPDTVRKLWSYGFIFPRYNTWKDNWVSDETINYITKYITKQDLQHKEYTPKILSSPGIGKCYTNSYNFQTNKFNNEQTKEHYTTRTGHKMALPIYWRNKAYTDHEREQLWINKLNKQERFVNGLKIDISKGEQEYWEAVKYARRTSTELGYSDPRIDYDQKEYEHKLREIKQLQRLTKEHPTETIITNKQRYENEYQRIINNPIQNWSNVSEWKPVDDW